MAIIKKTLPNNIVVGFDTERNSYCNLPKDYKEPDDFTGGDEQSTDEQPDENWPAEKLIEWVKTHNIDIGMATTPRGIMEKIKAAAVS